jgi:DGQHR domain-containing protein
MKRKKDFGDDYIKINLMPIRQKDKSFYIGKILASDLLGIYTVEPAEYDIQLQVSQAATFQDDEEYFNYLIDQNNKNIDDKPFQRKENKKRIKEIGAFLDEEEFALFPNSIITTCELLNDYIDVDEPTRFEDHLYHMIADNPELRPFSYLEEVEGQYNLYLPNRANSLLIIDGQHRIRGLVESNIDKDKYEVILSFIIGFDRSAVANLFYTINYNQKSVNKSLLYHLTGEFSREINEITFLHESIKILNEIEKSPFYKRIKMLGLIPKELPPHEKLKVTISQAFLIDYLLNTITPKAVNSQYPPIFLHFYHNKNERVEIIKFLIRYFDAVRSIFNAEWQNPESNILCKTIGIGALIKIMHYLYIVKFIDHYNYHPLDAIKIETYEIKEALRGIENIDLSTDGDFGKAASAGTLNKLKNRMVSEIHLFNSEDEPVFLDRYLNYYLPKYRNWVNQDK